MNLSNCVCKRDKSSVKSSMKVGWCVGRYIVMAGILGLQLRCMAWYSKVVKLPRGKFVGFRESWIMEAVPPPLWAGLCDSEKVKEGGQVSMRAAEALGVSQVSVRKRQSRLCVLMNSFIIKVFGVRERIFHRAI